LNLWDKLQELAEICADYEIDSPHHISFITSVFVYSSKESIHDDLTEKQISYLEALWERYANGDYEYWQEWVEENPAEVRQDVYKLSKQKKMRSRFLGGNDHL